ncbi:MAG: TlpA family protein disulfide reductase [Deltaproteobacteria bacterium]|nr:TlpA family protein disulfide reductase [Deltaproteobacteria bacterium]
MTRTWMARAAAVAGLCVLGLSASSCSTPEAAAASCTKAAPDCKPKVTFVDTAGHAYAPEALAGKVVVVNFWATWCKPCMAEIPAFSRVYSSYQGKKDVVMLGVMTDNPDEATLLNFTSDHELLYPVVRADRDIQMAFQYPDAIPTTFVYGRSGKLEASHRGPMNDDELKALIDKLLAEK